VFYISYIAAELRRRSGRTLLTALGLAVGVGLVVTVSALSNGLDDAQSKVLKPLTGVGTDISVNRPLQRSGSSGNFGGGGGPGGPPRLSSKEQEQLRKENGNRRFGFQALGKPGEHFSRDDFATTQLSFPASEVDKISRLSGVKEVASGLTLSAIHVEGTVPEQQSGPRVFGGGPGAEGPRNIDLDNRTVSGIDMSKPSIALVTPSQVSKGRYFSSGSAAKKEAVLSTGYARRKGIAVGHKVTIAGKKVTVVGISKPPLGGQASDAYLELGTLQKLANRKGRVNVLQVRAASADQVGSLSKKIESTFAGAQVTTSKELADRVGGSLSDTKNLSGKLGTALAIVALAAAFLIASFLTLSSVTKRVRELGTLKALGWRQSLVVRQVSGESLVQGLLGGVLGAAVGVAGAALIDAISPTLEATVARAGGGGGPGAGGPFAFGQGQIASGSTHVTLNAPVDLGLILLAMGLAIVGGLLAGAIGGLRAARLRPADALRHID
jgi:ABC-type antimicrobial peptide transport system permease subunit